MSKAGDIRDKVQVSATPSDQDVAAWRALPRDEQVRRYRAALSDPDCAAATDESMSDILAAARARMAGDDA